MDSRAGKQWRYAGIKDVFPVKKHDAENGFTGRKRRLRWSNANVQKTVVTLTFLFVPMFLLLLFTYLPFFKMVQFSFYDMGYIGERKWVGLDNYIAVFTRKDCFQALKLSLFYIAGALVQLILALLFAAILSARPKGGSFFRGALFFPSLVCGIAVGFVFKYFYTHGCVLDSILGALGVPEEALPYWLRDTRVNNWMLAASSVWRYMGQNMVLFIGAIASVDKTQFEAAVIDGANAWHRFRYITLPSIRTIVVLNLILAVSGSLSVFEIPYVVTGGGFGTSTYFVLMDQLAHVHQKVGLASAMAVVLLGLILLISAGQKQLEKRLDSGASKAGRRRGK